jgi:hypothetical protein
VISQLVLLICLSIVVCVLSLFVAAAAVGLTCIMCVSSHNVFLLINGSGTNLDATLLRTFLRTSWKQTRRYIVILTIAARTPPSAFFTGAGDANYVGLS